jgi:tetratricopeptide (TPR) repeat protein/transcriptional regulator with XRE-family HTH domain
MAHDESSLGSLLRRFRLAAGLTQEELAALSSLSVRTISYLETGRSAKPYRRSIQLLADALSLPPAERTLLLAVLRSQEVSPDAGEPPRLRDPERALRPAQLPSDIPAFAGRIGEINSLRSLLALGRPAGPVPIAAIIGAGGIGKSALAIHVAHELRRDFPDGQLFLELRGSVEAPLTSWEALARLLRHLGMSDETVPKDEAECAAEYRSRLADRRMLLVLDDARDAAQVRPLLPGTGSCAVVITSRRWLAELEGSQPLLVRALGRTEAFELFTSICGVERVAAEPAATETVLAACGGLPLAVRIAASRLLSRPGWQISSIADQLASEMNRLEELQVGDLAVRGAFQVSYKALARATGRDVARAFRLLGLWPGPDISLSAAAALLGADTGSAARMLGWLVDINLLEAPTATRYRFHDLIRVFAAECATNDETPASRERAVRRLLSWYLHGADAARAVIVKSPWPRQLAIAPAEVYVTPAVFGDVQVAADWAEDERDHLVAAVMLAARWRMHQTCMQLAESVWHCYMRSPWDGWPGVLEAAVNSAAAVGDEGSQAWLLNYMAVALMYRGEHAEAQSVLEDALPLSRSAGDLVGEATITAHLGVVCKELKRYNQAMALFDRALTMETSMYPLLRGRIQTNLGMLCVESGRVLEGADLLERGLAVLEAAGDQQGGGFARAMIADAYRRLGRYDDAIIWAGRALEVSRQSHDRYHEAAALSTLGQALADSGDTARALSCLERAHALAIELGVPQSAEIAASIAALSADRAGT